MAPRSEIRRERGRLGREEGRAAEIVAALLLMAKGYQILGFRLRTRQGEIDLLARRGRWLCVVEVKRRRTVEQALQAITPVQRQRLLLAGRTLADRRPSLRQLDLRLDLIALAPRRFPRHLRDILAAGVD
ncbi:MAG TPA: YraN family protein [Caulobacteraceae bacterium]|jgi:putative endonuclease|nr:YraN family protein [Caulobacteraceae bacterium]